VDLLVRGRYVAQPGFPSHQQDALWSGELRGIVPGTTGLVVTASPTPRDRKLRVVVLSPKGDPVPHATVYFQPAPPGRDARPPRTGKDGSVTLTELPASEIEVRVSFQIPKDFVPPQAATVVPDGQELVLRCREGVALMGVVVFADGTPAAGAHVNAFRDGVLLAGRADDAGRFRIFVPADGEGPIRLFAGHPGGADGKMRNGQVDVDSPAGEVRLELK